jgi:biotin operon repressor
MIREEIEQIKKQGINISLRNEIENRVWQSKKAGEEAIRDQFKLFPKMIIKAIKLLQDCQELYEEILKEV